jgi:hypothetical protein
MRELVDRVWAFEEWRNTTQSVLDSLVAKVRSLADENVVLQNKLDAAVHKLAIADEAKEVAAKAIAEAAAATKTAKENANVWSAQLEKAENENKKSIEQARVDVAKVSKAALDNQALLTELRVKEQAQKQAANAVLIDCGGEHRAPQLAEGVRAHSEAYKKQLYDHVHMSLEKLGVKGRVSVKKVHPFRSVKKRQGQADVTMTNIVVTFDSADEAKLVVDTAGRMHRTAVRAAENERKDGEQDRLRQPSHVPQYRYDLPREYAIQWRDMKEQKREWVQNGTHESANVRYDIEDGVPRLRVRAGGRGPFAVYSYIPNREAGGRGRFKDPKVSDH